MIVQDRHGMNVDLLCGGLFIYRYRRVRYGLECAQYGLKGVQDSVDFFFFAGPVVSQPY